jgi:hypothetical protein
MCHTLLVATVFVTLSPAFIQVDGVLRHHSSAHKATWGPVPAFPLSFGSSSLSGRSPAALVTHARRMILSASQSVSARPTAHADPSAWTPGAQVDRLSLLHSAAPGHARTDDTLACRLA